MEVNNILISKITMSNLIFGAKYRAIDIKYNLYYEDYVISISRFNDNYVIMNVIGDAIYDYFYSNIELRKMKLEKLNELNER